MSRLSLTSSWFPDEYSYQCIRLAGGTTPDYRQYIQLTILHLVESGGHILCFVSVGSYLYLWSESEKVINIILCEVSLIGSYNYIRVE